MALRCLFKTRIGRGKEIAVHPEATHYRCESGSLKQFYFNRGEFAYDGFKEIPFLANTIKFNGFQDTRGEDCNYNVRGVVEYGEAVFSRHINGRKIEVDSKGNLLNNRLFIR